VEKLQNDVRQTFLLFMADFTSPAHKDHPLYEEAVRRYEPLKGETAVHTIRETKKILEIIAILGGQWPHSSFMVPGGVVSGSSPNDIIQCRYLLKNYRQWYENRVLGCSLEQWSEINNKTDLDAWLEADGRHNDSDLGFFIRFSKAAGLDKIGGGHGNFISFGAMDMPRHTTVKAVEGSRSFFPAGFFTNGKTMALNQEKIAEDSAYAWYWYAKRSRHPYEGLTIPGMPEKEDKKYTWCKAPRYNGLPAETGPLAEMVIAAHPLITGLVENEGPSAYVRQLARLIRPAVIIPLLDLWLKEIADTQGAFFNNYKPADVGQGYGLVQASRGALGHWLKIKEGKITQYQVITPSAWNASPRDADGIRGPWEEALMGTTVKDMEDPVEVAHIVRSFDPCLVCTVHAVDGPRRYKPVTIR
jgi:hydrogenase large subunit